MTKQDTISKIYYDRSGFGSVNTTYKDAKAKDSSITLNDVKEFFKNNVEQKKQLRGYNSFVAHEAYWEYQADLFFVADLEKQTYPAGLLMVDIFSKYMVVIPVKSKSEGDVASGRIEGMNKMGKKPKILYTDNEGALNSNAIQKYLKENDILHYTTRGHSSFAERAIRTYKDMLYKRIENDEKKAKQNIQWVDYNLEILLTYNDKLVSRATGLTPKDGRKKDNELKVRQKLAMNARKNRLYPELDVGSKVKIYKKKTILDKERKRVWSDTTYTIDKIDEKLGQKYYHLNGYNKPLLRHEMLKV